MLSQLGRHVVGDNHLNTSQSCLIKEETHMISHSRTHCCRVAVCDASEISGDGGESARATREVVVEEELEGKRDAVDDHQSDLRNTKNTPAHTLKHYNILV